MTRRRINPYFNQAKIPVDKASTNIVDYSHGSKQPDKALPDNDSEGIKINQDVWDEMVIVGRLLCLTQDDPDLYDMFDWMRINIYGGLPYGMGLLSRVDSEISKELGPWEPTA